MRVAIIIAFLGTVCLGCAHYWGGVEQGEVRFSDLMSVLGPDVPIDLIREHAGEPKDRYARDDTFDVYLYHLIENSAWDGIPGPTAEAGLALLVERDSRRVRDVKVTFERALRYPGWEAFMAGLAAGTYRSRSISCLGTQSTVGHISTSSVFCTGW